MPSTTRSHKAALRQQLRTARRALSPAAQERAAVAAAQFLSELPAWPEYRNVALYLANDGELNTGPVAERCRAAGAALYLPTVDGNTLRFKHWDHKQTLIGNRYGIGEPPTAAAPALISALDLIFLPLVGWDRRGNRLGMGGGYYDRALADKSQLAKRGRPLLIGMAHALQEVAQLETEAWDISLDGVLTDRGLWRCNTQRW